MVEWKVKRRNRFALEFTCETRALRKKTVNLSQKHEVKYGGEMAANKQQNLLFSNELPHYLVIFKALWKCISIKLLF